MLAGFTIGLSNGTLISYVGIAPFIVTLGMRSMALGMIWGVTKGNPITEIPDTFFFLAQGDVMGIPAPVIIMAIIAVIIHIILTYTAFGRRIYAIGGNEEAARLSGIPVRRIKCIVYIIGGVTAALSGVILASRLGAGQAAAASGFELDVITAVVLGGVSITGGEGRLEGTLLGVFIIGILSNGLILLNVEPYYQLVIKGLALLSAIGLDRLRKRAATSP